MHLPRSGNPTISLTISRIAIGTTHPLFRSYHHRGIASPHLHSCIRPVGAPWLGLGWARQEAAMGLLEEILNTIQTSGAPSDPRAKGAPVPAPAPTARGGQGMSPVAKVLLTLLAIYAAKNLRRAPSPSTQPTSPTDSRGSTTTADEGPGGSALEDLLKGPLGGLLRGGTASAGGAGAGGGLGDLLKGPLGGILGGAAAGTVLNGG